ncbi:MAG: low temperature requirement protein A [Acidimicrobiales bacterium]
MNIDNETNGSIKAAARAWFRPPRAHGDIDEDRTVSFLELFYDLVFVVLVAQLAHTLAAHPTWAGVRDFAIVFGLVWIAWLNGTLYHELHGGEDGRSRSYIFVQMSLLVLMSVFTAHAADDIADGRGFAIVYAVLLAFLAWQWFDVRRQDNAAMRAVAARYVLGIVAASGIVGASAIIDDTGQRLAVWAAVVAVFLVLGLVAGSTRVPELADAFAVTESMAERFGLFTIIVLGEVVVGVADGLSEAERTSRTIITGLLALGIGFGIWWNYFDFVGRRQPRPGVGHRATWTLGHFPLAMSIAAAGAGMVSLIEHAADQRTPTGTAWLIGGATAAAAVSLAIVASTMTEHPGRRFVPYALVAAAGVSIGLAALRPAPWVLALGIFGALTAVWAEAFVRHARLNLPLVEA